MALDPRRGRAIRARWPASGSSRSKSAVRSLGRVRGMAGEVRTDGAELTVRFAPGTDPERKAARLDSELARLRARLPEGSGLWVDSAATSRGTSTPSSGSPACRGHRRGRPGRRRGDPRGAGGAAVEAFGLRDEEVRVELAASTLDPWTRRGCAPSSTRPSAAPALGLRQGDRLSRPSCWRRGRISPAAGADSERRGKPGGGAASRLPCHHSHPLAGPPSASASAASPPGPSSSIGPSAAPLPADGALRRRLARLPGGVRGEVGWSEAAPLRALVRRLALGAPAALGAAALGGDCAAAALGRPLARPRRPGRRRRRRQRLWLAGVALNVATLVAWPWGSPRPAPRRPSPGPPARAPGLGGGTAVAARGGAGGGSPRRRRARAAARRAGPGAAAGGGGGGAGGGAAAGGRKAALTPCPLSRPTPNPLTGRGGT